MDRRDHKRERQTDRYSDIDVVSHSLYNESNRDVSVLSPNRQQDVDEPPPFGKEGHPKKMRKLEKYSTSSSTSRGGKSKDKFVSSKKEWTG